MSAEIIAKLVVGYAWKLSLLTAFSLGLVTFLGKKALMIVPTLRASAKINADSFQSKMQKPTYAANQAWNRRWSLFFLAVIYGLIMPFCVTLEMPSGWIMLRDIVVILMFYDFIYYLTHRFLFHDSGFLGGPLKWMHAIHHRQHNPCRKDSSYIHPLEIAIGLGLFVSTIYGMSRVLGRFHVATVVITWIAFSEINQHNHDLWEEDKFPFKYMHYLAKMHHHHHAKFTGGNFATISLLYDWMFGSLDKGDGFRR
jgi:sterol desaturase/sphingolipid hydroxylase (fatty acid hydroxylase superfamily)